MNIYVWISINYAHIKLKHIGITLNALILWERKRIMLIFAKYARTKLMIMEQNEKGVYFGEKWQTYIQRKSVSGSLV